MIVTLTGKNILVKNKYIKKNKNLKNRLRPLLFVFNKLKRLMNRKTPRTIYCALFHNIVNYEIIAWGSASDNTIFPLIHLRKSIINLIANNQIIRNPPLSIHNNFIVESTVLCFGQLKNSYLSLKSVTEYKIIKITKINKLIYEKCYKYCAETANNKRPNHIKLFSYHTSRQMKKLKHFMKKWSSENK